MKRFLLILAGLLALAGLNAPTAQAQLRPTVRAWPDLAAGGYGFSCNRLQPPYTVTGTAASGNRFRTYQLGCHASPWATTELLVGFQCWYNTGSTTPERLPTTPCRLGGAAVSTSQDWSSGVTQVTFGCATCYSVVMQPGDFVWGRVTVSLSSGQAYWIRSYRNLIVGDQTPDGMFCNLPASDLGEGSINSSTAQNLLVQGSGAIAAMNTNSQCWGPSVIVQNGYDGTTPVFLVHGTSRQWGTNLYDLKAANRGALTAVGRGLISATGGRMAYGNLSAPGACALYNATRWNREFQLRDRMLRALPNRPYNRVIGDLPSDPNGINGGCGSATLAGQQALALDWVAFSKGNCPACLIYAVYGEPWANTANNLTFWSTLADQVPAATATYPTGLQFQVNAWLATPGALGPTVTTIDLSSAYQDATYPDRWKVPNPAFSGTVSGACNSGTRACTVTMNFLPSVGDNLVFEAGGANSETNIISNVSGTPSSALLTFGPSLGKSHPNGATVTVAPVRDGIHPSDRGAQAGQALIEAAKVAGTIH